MSTTTEPTVVIVGAGQAGAECAIALRQQGFDGRIVLLGDEGHLPYRRPPLSKAFLSGKSSQDALYIKSESAWDDLAIDCRPDIGVEAIDRGSRTLHLFDGTRIAYDKLVLATGGRTRTLSVPGAEHPNVFCIRTIDDVLALQEEFVPGRRLVIVGGGYIGLEVAAVAVEKGLATTVVEAEARVLPRVGCDLLCDFFAEAHRRRGVELRLGTGVHAFEGEERAEAVVLADGTRLPADLVVVGIGIVPNTELAAAAGLDVSDGIVVDAQTRTSDPDIHAIGDCSYHANAFYGRSMRLESVPNAMEQGRVAAAVLAGKPAEHRAVPWFWSDQYDLKLQMVGLARDAERQVLRGSPEDGAFMVFHMAGDRAIAADAVNRPQEFALARRLVGERIPVQDAQLADTAVALKDLLAR
ncbi:NAD(P)/FAD-dependent oxidoreductase [Coralloluteibacterium thermophilus]|uniref:NAD(P)/FAD-dependent oxidoreductase n=1 Tax=Coralloluteibacterium thermophilum TaxID=2707049 RepID=A0ABV9NNQ0_9GAMM